MLYCCCVRRDLKKIQKDLDAFREIPFQTIRFLVEEAKVWYDLDPSLTFHQDDVEDEANHGDAFDKFKAIERKAIKAIFSSKVENI